MTRLHCIDLKNLRLALTSMHHPVVHALKRTVN